MSSLVRCAAIVSAFAGSALADAPADSAYLDGLDQLQSRQWAEAEKSLAQAVAPNDGVAAHYLARGVAAMMAGDANQAASDLQRANEINPPDIQTRRWYEAFLRSTGQTRQLTNIRGGRYSEPSDAHGTGHHSQTLAEAAEALRAGENPQARASVERFAVAFAADAKSKPEAFDLLKKRMQVNYLAGNYQKTLSDLAPLMAAQPRDNDLLYHHASSLRCLGQYADAREELTRVLTLWPEYASGYSERAIAQANLGNLPRAKADIALSAKFDPADAKQMQPAVDQAIAAYTVDPATESPADKLAALQKAAASGQAVEQLVPLAVSLVKCMNAHRLRWDEGYQERIRQLDEPIQANNKNIPAILAFGEFIYQEADVFGAHDGPGAPIKGYRYEGPNQVEQELDLADSNFNAVLDIDPKNAAAMVWKAGICLHREDWDGGKAWIDKAQAINPDMPEMVEVLTRVQDIFASMSNYEAVGLRMSHSWTEYGEMFDTVYTRNPSPEELARANALNNGATQLLQSAQASLAKAAAARAGTADGFYYTGLLQKRQGDTNGAIASFLKAWQMDESRRNTDALTNVLMQAKQFDYAIAARHKFSLTRETNDTPFIAAAWVNIEKGDIEKSTDFVQRALAIDPADSRIPAYQAAIAVLGGKSDIALQQLNAALAIEEANANLNGQSLLKGDARLNSDAVCRAMMLNLRAAARCAQLGRADDEISCLNRNAALANRISSADAGRPSFASILPDPPNPSAIQPRSALNLLAWTHVMLGYALAGQQRYDEAAKQFGVVWSWAHKPELFGAQQRAIAGLSRLQMAKTDRATGKQWLANAASPRGLTNDEVMRIGAVRQSSQGDIYELRRYAVDSTFNRSNGEDLTVPDASLGMIDNTPPAAGPADSGPPRRR